MSVDIRQAENSDAAQVAAILSEAERWLSSINQSLWQCNEFADDQIAEEVRAGLFFIARMEGEAVGVLRFELADPLFWPDIPAGNSAFLHRLAVKRKVAGSRVAGVMLDWAKARTKQLGLTFLRLDCVQRPKLCAFYERNGFIKHSERQVGPYYVVRYECNTENSEQPVAADGAACCR